MGHSPTNGDDPDEFDKLIKALGATWRFEIRQPLEKASVNDAALGEAEGEVLDDLSPRNLEELRMLLAPVRGDSLNRYHIEAAMTPMVVALCILSIAGAIVFIVTGSVAVLIAILTFFSVQFARIFRRG